MTLSARIASASVEQTREMLEEAWEYLFPKPESYAKASSDPDTTDDYLRDLADRAINHSLRRGRFQLLLRQTAYHDAAMMLIPEGWAIERMASWPHPPPEADNFKQPWAIVCLCETRIKRVGRHMIWGHGNGDRRVELDSVSAPLAIAAAAVKVKECENVATN